MLKRDYCLLLIYDKAGIQRQTTGGAETTPKKCELPSESPSPGLLLWRRNNICQTVDAGMWETVFTEAMSLPRNRTESFSLLAADLRLNNTVIE